MVTPSSMGRPASTWAGTGAAASRGPPTRSGGSPSRARAGDHHRRERVRVQVKRRHAPHVGGGDPRDALAVALRIVEAEPRFFQGNQESGDLGGRVHAKRIAPDEI